MNTSSEVEIPDEKYTIYFSFIVCGIVAVATNLVVVFVYNSTAALRSTYLMTTALAIADLLNGLSFVLNGAYKLVQIASLTHKPKFTFLDCVFMPWPAFRVIGSQWPAMLTFCLGFERFLAVRFPFVYISSHDRRHIIVVIITAVLAIASLILAHIYPLIIARNRPSNFACSLVLTFGEVHSEFMYAVTIICHALGFVFSMIAYHSAKESARKAGNNDYIKKEISRAKIILLMSLLSVIFVAVPNILLAITAFLKTFAANITGYTCYLFCIRSSMNIVVFGAFNTDFRSQLIKVVKSFSFFHLKFQICQKIRSMQCRGYCVFPV
uniref:G_PROTEIN_RECEP_F1_2 domain-containing protein n=1 Tax=Ascaris lumbricoides TaxID=6252 RepID=A0A0M3IDW8_ASCLU